MAKWIEYLLKKKPADEDMLMLEDAETHNNKRVSFSGIADWLIEKMKKNNLISGALRFKGSSAYAALPGKGAAENDYYYCTDGDGTHGPGYYAWNGSSWIWIGNNDKGIDKSLKVEGAAAEAAATGEAIASLKEDLVKTETKKTILFTEADGYSTGNGYYDKYGSLHNASGFSHAYVSVEKANQVVIHSDNTANSIIVNYVDSDKKFISNLLNWNQDENTTINKSDIPNNAKYICISSNIIYDSYLSVSVSENTIKGELDLIRNDVKNIEPLQKEAFGSVLQILFTEADGYSSGNGYYDKYGSLHNESGFSHCYIDLIGGVFTVRALEKSLVINFVDKDKKFVKNLINWNHASEIVIEKSSIPSNAKYICVSCGTLNEKNVIVQIDKQGLRKLLNNEIDIIKSKIETSSQNQYRNDASYSYALSNNYPFMKCVFLDCGRKYFSVENIKKLIDEMASVKLNTLQLYFSDHKGFRFGLDDMYIRVNGVTHDLSIALGDGDSPSDGSGKWLTESDMNTIIEYANSKNVDIVPAFDMPGHMNAIINKFQEFGNVANENTVTFYCNIIEKYASYFRSKGCRFYNICGDESNIDIDTYTSFINKALSIIIKHDLTPMIFNDEICKNGMLEPNIINSTIVCSWTVKDGEPSPLLLEKCGYRQINCDYRNYYWTLGYSNASDDWVDKLSRLDYGKMTDGSHLNDLYGVMFCIWCDAADTDGADGGTAVISNTKDLILAFGKGLSHYDKTLYKTFNGEECVMLGDSITWYDERFANAINANIIGYKSYLQKLGLSITNKGVSGARWADISKYEDLPTTADNTDFSKYDIVTLMAGINDYISSSPLGIISESDFDRNTFIGGMQYVIKKIFTDNPKIKILLATPLKCTTTKQNTQSLSLIDYANAIKQVAELYSIPVLDLYLNSGFNKYNLLQYTFDGLHPNNDGFELICNNLLIPFFKYHAGK